MISVELTNDQALSNLEHFKTLKKPILLTTVLTDITNYQLGKLQRSYLPNDLIIRFGHLNNKLGWSNYIITNLKYYLSKLQIPSTFVNNQLIVYNNVIVDYIELADSEYTSCCLMISINELKRLGIIKSEILSVVESETEYYIYKVKESEAL